MGTNYYAVRNNPTIESPIHIGKKSVGWLFCFEEQHQPWRDIPVVWNNYDQVKRWLKTYTVDRDDYVIIDEHDRIVSYDEFIRLVEDSQSDKHCLLGLNFANSKNVGGYRFVEGDFC